LEDQNIEVITCFTNLEELYLGTDIISRLEKNIYNGFNGSLKLLLQSCKKLKKLQIEGTGIDYDLKNIPKNLKVIS